MRIFKQRFIERGAGSGEQVAATGYRLSALIFSCCLLLFCGCGQKKADRGWSDSIAVEALVVSAGDNAGQRDYVGVIGSEVEVDMSFILGGTLTKVAVSNGQKVRKGQVLAEVDGTTVSSLHNTALATLRQAEDAYNRLKNVHSEGGISDVRWIQMETDLEKARQAEVAARKRVEDCVIKAPFDGVVSCRNHHVGEEMRPMEPFARVLDLRRLRVGFSVPEQEVGLLPMGSTATATIPALDDRELTLKINDKSLIANPMGHTYRVYATIVSGDAEGTVLGVHGGTPLLPDMVAKVHVTLDAKAGIVVPSECVSVMPEGTVVWVVSGGKAYHRAITVGDFVRNGVVVESGLAGGDTVVTLGQQKLYNGARVKLKIVK